MLSILPKTLPPTLKFLQPYIPSLSSPPAQALIYAAINNPSFFTAFNAYVVRTANLGHHSVMLLQFWAGVMTPTINGMLDAAMSGRVDVRSQRQEDLLLRVIPVLQQTLRIKNVPELFLGSCMIICVLVSKTQLDDKVLDSLMDAVSRGWTSQTLDQALSTVAIIAEERQSLKLTRSVTKALMALPALDARMLDLQTKQHTGKLLTGLAMTSLDEAASDEAFDLIESAVTSHIPTLPQKAAIVRLLFSAVSDLQALPEPAAAQERLARIFASLCQSPSTLPLVQAEAARLDLSLESVEVQLQISLVSSEMLALPSADADTEMTDGPVTTQADHLDEAISSLPQDLSKDYSFVANADVSPFDAFARAFLILLQQNKDLDRLLGTPVLHGADALTSPTYLSFLARLWTSVYPIVARVSALRSATALLQAHSSEVIDMQALVPFALVALADASEAVRKAAAGLLIAITTLYHPDAAKSKVNESIKPWAAQSVYAAASKKSSLTGPNIYKVLSDALVPSLEECVLDPSQIARVLASALNGPTQTQPGHPSANSMELKSTLRTSFASWLCEHAAAVPLASVKIQLLSFLSPVGKAASTGRVQTLVPSLQSWIQSDLQTRSASCASAHIDVTSVDKAYVDCLTSRTSEELTCLRTLANGELGQSASLSTLAIQRFRALWPSMKPIAQTSASAFLLDLALDDQTDDISEARQSEATDLLRQVSMPTEVLLSMLESVPSIAQMEDKPPSTKRRRTSRSELAKSQSINVTDLHNVIRRLTLVLELIEGSHPERHPELLKSLFHVLSELQHYRTQLGSNLVYLQQLVIGCLFSIVDSLKQNPAVKVDRSVLRADLIVECVRTSTNAQIHNAALLLISSLSSWAPDLVLHSVMPIFTFMSNTLLRQSDDYSAHVIDQTVSRVVPPLVASLRKKNQDLVTGAAELLLSFTAAFEHIPLHRRLRLFSHLVTALGPQDFLPAITAMLFDKYPTDKRVPTFSAELMGSFSPEVQLIAASQYIDLATNALQPKSVVSEAIFGFSDKTPEQIEQSVAHLLRSLGLLLQQRSLHVQILKALDKDASAHGGLQSAAADILRKIMQFSSSKSIQDKPDLQSASNDVLTAALSLLPTPYFVRTAEELLQRPEQDLRLMVLHSLEQRGREAKLADATAANAMLSVLPSVTSIISHDGSIELVHSAVTCVDVISEKFGKKATDKVMSAARVVASKHAFGSQNDELRIISLLCLATIVEVLRDDLVDILPQILTTSYTYFDYATRIDSGNARLHNAVYSFLTNVIEYISWMFSAETLDKALLLTQQSACSEVTEIRTSSSRPQFTSLLSQKLDARTILAALERTFDNAVTLGHQACQEVLATLHTVIKTHPKSALIKNASILFSILNKSFDLRRLLSEQPASPDNEQLAAMEAQRDSLSLDAIMRLNDTTFRPFFTRLVSWAGEGLPKKEQAGRTLRLISVYGFLARFFETLKVSSSFTEIFGKFTLTQCLVYRDRLLWVYPRADCVYPSECQARGRS
jgi:U3 small nucleolar RNA-associated protein 10